jgi:hypothetical protein
MLTDFKREKMCLERLTLENVAVLIQGLAGKPDVFKLQLVWAMVVWEESAH